MQDFENLDYYALLGVERMASSDEIKRAYRQQIMRYHPDRYLQASPDEQAYARDRAQRINEAYAVLSDFAARSAYNRGRTSLRAGGGATAAAAPSPPAVARDHQAELYTQARTHLDAGRDLQAIAALRQLQQVNPFYRDSATLLAEAEARARIIRPSRPEVAPLPRESPPHPITEDTAASPSRRWLIGGAIGGTVLALLIAAAVGLRGRVVGNSATATALPVAGVDSTVTDSAVAGGEPTATAEVPAPTLVPMVEPAVVPTASNAPKVPTLMPSLAATTTLPSPTAMSSATPMVEQGAVLNTDTFDGASGWASVQNQFWSVGYDRGRYRISVEPGVGNIWSYRTVLGDTNYSAGVDIEVHDGSAGLLIRYADRSNYLVCLIAAEQGLYRVEQHSAGRTIIVAQGPSDALDRANGASNRLVVRVQDNDVTLLINGALVTKQTVPRLPQTKLYGLVAASDGASTEAFFDNLEIRSGSE